MNDGRSTNGRLVCLAGVLALLTACGSATDAITFTAPPSFHPKASVGPFMQIWEAKPHAAIVLMSLPVELDLDKAMDQADIKDARIEKRERITICGAQSAVFAKGQGQESDASENGPSEVQFLATNVKGKTYMAIYARPLHSAADPAAEAAIRNLCAK